jgi:hypothetical protein
MTIVDYDKELSLASERKLWVAIRHDPREKFRAIATSHTKTW